MLVRRLTLSQFRSYERAELDPAPGLTVIIGRNGQGKTNLVEAIAYLSTLSSFRGVPSQVLIRDGAEASSLAIKIDTEGRAIDIETTIARRGPNKTVVNGQRLTRSRDLLGSLRVTVFTPDDLELIKGGPSGRRNYLDELLVALRPSWDLVLTDLDRVLRQRATLLKQSGGRLDGEVLSTLDVWDTRLAELGTKLGEGRRQLVAELSPLVAEAYGRLAGDHPPVQLVYDSPWMDVGLYDALMSTRIDDARRGLTTVGPHRDELRVELRHTPARTHGSQGEQQCLALALRLAGHQLVGERQGTPPILLLDDVFSELDPQRTAALIANLPAGQALLTTAEKIPDQAQPELIVRVENGTLS
ncbi:MAG: DNA replication/repair protein RecF [Acidimicrobiia bacterium]